MRAPVLFFDTTPLGRILNRFSKDQDGVDSGVMDALRMFLTMFSTVIATFILIIIAIPWFAIPMVPVLAFYYVVQKIYRSVSLELKRLDAISRSPVYSQIGETLTGNLS
jgi:ATP-binding cassette, subfamily C (CFTR/MRP), member 1